MTEKQKGIYVAIGIFVVLLITLIIELVVHVAAGNAHVVADGPDVVADSFTLKDLENLKNQTEAFEECVPDCLMKQSDIEKKLGMSNKGTCFDVCLDARLGSEDCMQDGGICHYRKTIGRKMYAITIEYLLWEGELRAQSIDWEKGYD